MLLAPLLLAVSAADVSPLPVQSITAFKDGHALVIREGERAVEGGEIKLDGLPNPLLGSFWPYTPDEGLRVVSATASRWEEDSERDVQSVQELLAQNVGKHLIGFVRDEEPVVIDGKILAAPQNGQFVIVEDAEGNTRAFATNDLVDVAIDGEAVRTIETKEGHTGLRLRLSDDDRENAKVGLLYVEKGFRWIPQYRMTLNKDGTAEAVLRATLVNDLIDLEDAEVNLVIGVPTFAFAGQTDPIALNANVQQAVQAVDNFRMMNRNGALQQQIMTNSAYSYDFQSRDESGPPAEVTGGAKSEDLFVFTLDHVTLKRGERMSIEIARQTLEYKHVYEVDLPILPPNEISGNQQQNPQFVAAAKALAAPQVAHRLEIKNPTDQPLTTAPVLLFTAAGEREQLLAQSLQTYTPAGGKSQIELGTAIDVSVRFDEEESDRVPNAVTRGDNQFDRVNLTGRITAVNRRDDAITLRIRRYVPGPITEVTDDGTKKALAPYDQEAATAAGDAQNPYWWYGFRPSWYASLNPVSRAEWSLDIEPHEELKVAYEWHYFWRW